MQISISKYILLISLSVLPLVLSAQIGKRKYVTRSGDTTLVVMAGSTGLHGEDAQFLLDQGVSEDFVNRRSRYTRLKDAAIETNQVAGVVEIEKQETNPSTGSLGFRIAQQNIRFLQREKEAEQIARTNINRDATVSEMVYLKEKFGSKPTFFINGVQVDAATAARIREKDILTRELRVTNTATGNPNGEIWMVVGTRAFERLGLDVHYAEQNNLPEDDIYNSFEEEYTPSVAPASVVSGRIDKSLLDAAQREKVEAQEREIEELRNAIAKYGNNNAGDFPDTNNRQAVAGRKEEPANLQGDGYAQPSASSTETRVITQRKNNRFVDTGEEIVSFKDSPQERSRRARDKEETYEEYSSSPRRSDSEDVIQVSNQADKFSDPNITKETPKRSVRRIKERQRNQ